MLDMQGESLFELPKQGLRVVRFKTLAPKPFYQRELSVDVPLPLCDMLLHKLEAFAGEGSIGQG